jgi:hypothetical protein
VACADGVGVAEGDWELTAATRWATLAKARRDSATLAAITLAKPSIGTAALLAVVPCHAVAPGAAVALLAEALLLDALLVEAPPIGLRPIVPTARALVPAGGMPPEGAFAMAVVRLSAAMLDGAANP